jgi:hypothetical protein
VPGLLRDLLAILGPVVPLLLVLGDAGEGRDVELLAPDLGVDAGGDESGLRERR